MTAGAQGWSLVWRSGWDAVCDPALAADWERLAATTPDATIFQTRAMTLAWLETLGRDRGVTPALVRGRHADGTEALAVFTIEPVRWRDWRRRTILGAGHPNFDWQMPLIGGGDAARHQGFWDALGDLVRRCGAACDLLTIGRVPEAAAPSDARVDPALGAPVIELGAFASLADYLGSRSGSHRSDVKRQQRRLEARGAVALAVFGPGDVDPATTELAALIDAHRREWRERGLASLFDSPAAVAFYRRMVRDLLPAGQLHFSILTVGGRPVSWVFALLSDSVLHYYKPAFDPEFAPYSPGKVHLALLIEAGLRAGWRRIDLGPGIETYKRLWTDMVVPMRQPTWRMPTLRGRLRAWMARRRRRAASPPVGDAECIEGRAINASTRV